MAPGIPNQDEVLCHQPPETFVNMIHEQFNNEMPWLVNGTFGKGQTFTKAKPDLLYNNTAQPFDYQKIEPMRADLHAMREEINRMQQEYDLANERFASLKEKHDKLQYDYQKDKDFYE